jgi:hypothetical protein
MFAGHGGSQERLLELSSGKLADDEIDPADFFDPEEFGFRRGDLRSFDP